MDYLGEFIALGIDSLILGICLNRYCYLKNSISALKNVEILEVGDNLEELIKKNPNNYVALRGTVKAMGEPIRSLYKNDITGVVQKFSVKESGIVWPATIFLFDDQSVSVSSSSNFWYQDRILQESYNSVPFVLQKGATNIEVVDALSADVLDMEMIYNFFEPSPTFFSDYLWGFLTGYRQRGLRTIEEMLKQGSLITGIGELSKSSETRNSIVLQSPGNSKPFYLTTRSINSLIKELNNEKKSCKWLCIIFGAIGVLIGGIVIHRYLKNREEQRRLE